MSAQPEALRLADALELDPMPIGWYSDAAAELRRLHAANTDCMDHFNVLKADYDRLERINTHQSYAMRLALSLIERGEQKAEWGEYAKCVDQARDVLRAALAGRERGDV